MRIRKILNRHLLAGSLLMACATADAQSVAKLYVGMPDRLCPLLTGKMRMELVEYKKAGQTDSAQNRMGGKVFLQVLDTVNSRIVVQHSANSTFEMKLLTTSDKRPLVGIIRTVCAPVCHSVVEFYDTAWKKMPVVFDIPRAIKWVDPVQLVVVGQTVDTTWVSKTLETGFVSLRFDDKNPFIIASNHTPDFLSDDDRKVISPLLRTEPFIYRFDEDKWVLTK